MAVLWAFIGMNPVYEILCGTAELMGGVLLLFRRTALFGALTTAFVVTNVMLYNFCFDVPVKPCSVHPLLLALFVTLPDAGQLIRFFWLHKAAAPTGIWVPPASRPWFRRTTVRHRSRLYAAGSGRRRLRSHAVVADHACRPRGARPAAWRVARRLRNAGERERESVAACRTVSRSRPFTELDIAQQCVGSDRRSATNDAVTLQNGARQQRHLGR